MPVRPAPRRAAVVCLAAGPVQVPVIRAALAEGFAVLAVDRDPSAPGLALADETILASTHDAAAVLEALRPHLAHYRIVGILNRSSGPPVVTAAELSAALRLPGVPPASARTVIDKAQLAAFCRSVGIPAPQSRVVERLEELATYGFALPSVVKPALSLVGKGGVRILRHASALPAAFEAARLASWNGRVVVEDYVPGRNVGLVAFVRDGQLWPVTLIDEANMGDVTGGVEGRAVVAPSVFSGGEEERALLWTAAHLASRLGIDQSPFMLSCRVAPGGLPQVIELHLDLAGDRILDTLLPAATGVDTVRLAVDILTGGPIPREPLRIRPTAVRVGPAAKGPELVHAARREELAPLLARWTEGRAA